MKKIHRFFITFFIALFTASFCLPIYAAKLPADFTARYEIKKGFIKIGTAQRSLKRKSNGEAVYTSDSKTTGFISSFFKEHILQTTRFRFENELIKPLVYFYSRNNGKKTVEQTYDWQKKIVRSQRNDKLFVYDIPDKVQDQSIYQLSLMLDLADGKRNFTYHIAENVRLVDYRVKQIGSKKITTDIGKFNTVVMQVKNSKITTTIWLAKALSYLPVKIEHEEGGATFTAYIKSVSGL